MLIASVERPRCVSRYGPRPCTRCFFLIVGVSRVVWGNWHDHLLAAGVVPVERVVDAVTDHPDRLTDGERVTRDPHRRLLWRSFAFGELGCDRDFLPGRDDHTAVAVVVLVVG